MRIEISLFLCIGKIGGIPERCFTAGKMERPKKSTKCSANHVKVFEINAETY
jgi:hypothetical protein